MKKILVTILLFVVSTIFCISLLSTLFMPQNQNMEYDCTLSNLSGRDCFFKMVQGIEAITKHICVLTLIFAGIIMERKFGFGKRLVSYIFKIFTYKKTRCFNQQVLVLIKSSIQKLKYFLSFIQLKLLQWLQLRIRNIARNFQNRVHNSAVMI